ncbi:aldo/keto reductase [Clavulina sp. PMI_390]|nr:aldo/keto reductase [Clavulina sp. PMI_390]
MPLPYTTLAGGDDKVVKVAHGLMLMTWKTPVVDDETAFASIKAGLDLAGPDEKVMLVSGEFYGVDPPTANLELLSRFFAKYPEYVDRAFLSVKGGSTVEDGKATLIPDSSLENLRRSVNDINKALGGFKKVDMFEVSRLDGKNSIEEIAASLKTLQEEGLVKYVALSEVSASTLRRACKVVQIAAVEIEVSPTSFDAPTQEVVAAAKELGVAVCAYAPLGRGLLTGTFKPEELGKGDFRLLVPRLQAGALEENQKIVDAIGDLAKKKGVTSAQLCIAWVASLGDNVIPLPGSSKATRTLENFAAANITFTPTEKEELDKAVASFVVAGDRYPGFAQPHLLM